MSEPVKASQESASTANDATTKAETQKKKRYWRALTAYWILGLCNNYGYVVILTGAGDIIGHQEADKEKIGERQCTLMSTGAILLADILPSLTAKSLAPFLPFFVRIRVAVCVSLAASGFVVVAVGTNWVVILTGVVCTSVSSGFGEATYLQYSNYFDKNVLSTWSSGTGGAGVFGSLSYSLLHLLGLRTTLFIMLIVPALMGITFFIILPKPEAMEMKVEIQTQVNVDEIVHPKEVVIKKIKLIPSLLKYMIPLAVVYLFEYFINQGTFELINFKNIKLSQGGQYRWLQVTYQVGVLISRSSVNLIYIRRIWILSIFQALNVIVFTLEVIYYYIPNFWIVVLLVLWEGLLGGAGYVNTFYKMAIELPEENKQFSMALTSFSDSLGIASAGVLAMIAHNAICKLPLPEHERNITNSTPYDL